MKQSGLITLEHVQRSLAEARLIAPEASFPARLEIANGDRSIASLELRSPPAGRFRIPLGTALSPYAYRPVLGTCRYRLVDASGEVPLALDPASHQLLDTATTAPSWTADDLILGREDFLFLKAGTNRVMDVHQGRLGFNAEQIERWRRNLGGRAAAGRSLGIPCLTAIVPNKETVYHSLIPGVALAPDRPVRALSGLAEAAGAADTVHLMEDTLQPLAADLRLYNRTNSYWTDWGAAIAYNGLVPRLRRHGVSQAVPLQLEAMASRQIEEVTEWGAVFSPVRFESAKVPSFILGNSRVVYDNKVPNRGHLRIHKSAGRTGRVLLFCDSFTFNVLWKFFAEQFGTVVMARHAAFDAELVRLVQPDLVINVMVERFLIYPPNDEADTPFREVVATLGKAQPDSWDQVLEVIRQ